MNVYKFNAIFNNPIDNKKFTFRETIIDNNIMTFVFLPKKCFRITIPLKTDKESRKKIYQDIIKKYIVKNNLFPIKIVEDIKFKKYIIKNNFNKEYKCPVCTAVFRGSIDNCPRCKSKLILSDFNEYIEYFN